MACTSLARDFGVRVAAADWSEPDKDSGVWVAEVTLDTEKYPIPFSAKSAYVSAVRVPGAANVTLTAQRADVTGDLPASAGDLYCPFDGATLSFTVSGLATVPDAHFLLSSLEAPCV